MAGVREEFERLVEIMRRLRAADGCPWDRQQTEQSLQRYLIEEVYEALEAVDDGDWERLCCELGDVLLQVVFYAQLAAEKGRFTIEDVLRCINQKLIRRHPHVFGTVKVGNAEEVLVNWERIKTEQEGDRRTSLVEGIARGLPALQEAEKVQQRARQVGFDWPEISGVWAKVEEEVQELRRAAEGGDKLAIDAELGDLLFAVVNLARFLGIDPEQALRRATRRFVQRFREVEAAAEASGKKLQEMTLDEMDALWEAAKGGDA
ncbi:MAG: nucleoside triphosphate pyrophosphohydrolase [Armatimonadetes bacterium]|nr:nucleoside triphosphate pyrophosphohydrolase [Armatimonadota bacterium]